MVHQHASEGCPACCDPNVICRAPLYAMACSASGRQQAHLLPRIAAFVTGRTSASEGLDRLCQLVASLGHSQKAGKRSLHADAVSQNVLGCLDGLQRMCLCHAPMACPPATGSHRSCSQAHEAITKMPRWQLHGGQDFIFADPHPGFASGPSLNEWRDSFCQRLHGSIQLIVDRCASCC